MIKHYIEELLEQGWGETVEEIDRLLGAEQFDVELVAEMNSGDVIPQFIVHLLDGGRHRLLGHGFNPARRSATVSGSRPGDEHSPGDVS